MFTELSHCSFIYTKPHAIHFNSTLDKYFRHTYQVQTHLSPRDYMVVIL